MRYVVLLVSLVVVGAWAAPASAVCSGPDCCAGGSLEACLALCEQFSDAERVRCVDGCNQNCVREPADEPIPAPPAPVPPAPRPDRVQ